MTEDLLTPAEQAKIRTEVPDNKKAFCKAFADDKLSHADLQKIVEIFPNSVKWWVAFRAFLNAEEYRGGITPLEMTRLITEKNPLHPMLKTPEMEKKLFASHKGATFTQIKQRIILHRDRMATLMEIIKFAKSCRTEKGFDTEAFNSVNMFSLLQLNGMFQIADQYKDQGITRTDYLKIAQKSKDPALMADPNRILPVMDANLKNSSDLLKAKDVLTFLAYEPLWAQTGIDMHLKHVRKLADPQAFMQQAVTHPELLSTATEVLRTEKDLPKPIEIPPVKKTEIKRVPKPPKKVLNPLERFMKRPDIEELASKTESKQLLNYLTTLLIVLDSRANTEQKTKDELISLKDQLVAIYGR